MTDQDRIDADVATAQATIAQARRTAFRLGGRVGLRQVAAMLATELSITREETARCYRTFAVTYPTTEG